MMFTKEVLGYRSPKITLSYNVIMIIKEMFDKEIRKNYI